jgi:hypothetical protein
MLPGEDAFACSAPQPLLCSSTAAAMMQSSAQKLHFTAGQQLLVALKLKKGNYFWAGLLLSERYQTMIHDTDILILKGLAGHTWRHHDAQASPTAMILKGLDDT